MKSHNHYNSKEEIVIWRRISAIKLEEKVKKLVDILEDIENLFKIDRELEQKIAARQEKERKRKEEERKLQREILLDISRSRDWMW